MFKKLSILLAAALLAACSVEREEGANGTKGPESGVSLTFTYENPAAGLSRVEPVPASDAEKAIRDMDVFMFLADGTFVRKLTAGDYSAQNNSATSTISVSKALVHQYVGQQAVFYFVANNAASTDGVHLDSFGGTTEAEFRELLTQPLAESGYMPGKSVEIGITAGTGGLLMTGRSNTITLAGTIRETIRLKRRVARFDLYLPVDPANIHVENFYITDAAVQATMFGNSSALHTIATRSVEPVWGPDDSDYDTQGYVRSVFYLYPTTLATTRIAIEVRNNNNQYRIFTLDNDVLSIEANKRYTLIFDGNDLKVDSNTGDWEESNP